MLDYKRLTFILLFLCIFLIATDTPIERQAQKSLDSFFNIAVTESGQVSDTAPSSFIDTLEGIRIGTYNFLHREKIDLDKKSVETKGFLSFLIVVGIYVIDFLKFIANFVITFYPFVIFLLYMFFTSRIFKKDEFGYDNF